MPDVFTSSERVQKPALSEKKPLLQRGDVAEHLQKEREGQTINIPPGTNIHRLPGHTHNPLSAYCFYPDNVRFINADPKEKIILLLRKHPITNLPWIILSIIMLITPSFAMLVPLFDELPPGFQTMIFLSWYLITFAFVLEKFLDWFFNVNLITDERIFDVDFVSLMYREVTEADIDQIQDVTAEVGGAIRTLFGFGNVYIQTAAQIPRVEFHAVPNPDSVSKVLRELSIQEEIEQIEGRIR